MSATTRNSGLLKHDFPLRANASNLQRVLRRRRRRMKRQLASRHHADAIRIRFDEQTGRQIELSVDATCVQKQQAGDG